MASAFSHALVALTLGKLYTRQPMPWRFWFLSMGCAILPDADVIGFVWHVPYGHLLGHRGLSHALCFAALLAVGVVWGAFPHLARWSGAWWKLVLYFTLVTASHGVLDAMTNGGLGIAFLAPFDTGRYFFPWHPIQVSPIGIMVFFSQRGWRVLQSECQYIWLPMAGLYALSHLMQYWPRLYREQEDG
jgi:inner membrane protein